MPKKRVTRPCSNCPARTTGSRCESCRVKRNARLKKIRQEKIKAGICYRCTTPATEGLTCCEKHRTGNVRSEYFTERNNKRKSAGLCVACPDKAETGSSRCRKCRDRSNEVTQRSRQRERDLVFEHYGLKCVCCGESELMFLTIDHINGGGSQHRREEGFSSGQGFYHWLVKNEFPEGFQTLCMNCNLGKHRNGGVCPHRK